jgi:uncharacterized protein YkwD
MMKRFKNALTVAVGVSALFIWLVSAGTPVQAELAVPDSGAVPSTVYSHGDPTVKEQLMLEITNRCRANPYTDIVRIFNTMDSYTRSAVNEYDIDQDAMIADFESYEAKPPLAFNSALISAARDHNDTMQAGDFQGHGDEDDGEATVAARLTAAGYTYSCAGENVFCYAHSLSHAHASFIVDWGQPAGSDPIGHRKNILDLDEHTAYREIGIGVLDENDSSTSVGPMLVTQEFGLDNTDIVFITGVVYEDGDSDSFYDLDEGMNDIEIMPDHGDYYAVTSTSGGYAIPVAANSGTYTLTATRSDLAVMTATVQVLDENVKLDFNYGDSEGTGTISGTVVDGDGSAVANVSITLSNDQTTVSGSDGSFSFTGLASGAYTLTASLDGYTITPETTTISLIPDQTFTIELKATTKDDDPSDIVKTGCGTIGMVLMALMAMGFKGLSLTSRKNDQA